MKISKEQLQKIIREELQALREGHGMHSSPTLDQAEKESYVFDVQKRFDSPVGMTVGELRDLLMGYPDDEHVDVEELLSKQDDY